MNFVTFDVALVVAMPIIASSANQYYYDDEVCSAGFVDCVDGVLAGDSTITCADACEGNCCVGLMACDSFTGKICKNGSCLGYMACYNANIPMVMSNSCSGGQYACRHAGSENGTVGTIVNSCIGNWACDSVGRRGGTVGDIINSCVGSNGCRFAGHDGGVIAGHILNSCLGSKACDEVGRFGGTVGFIENSCNGMYACDDLAKDGGEVGDVDNSCISNEACTYAAMGTNGSIGNITSSCNAFQSCYEAGRANVGVISSSLIECCNDNKECRSMSEMNLPVCMYLVRLLSIFLFFISCQLLDIQLISFVKVPAKRPSASTIDSNVHWCIVGCDGMLRCNENHLPSSAR